MKTLRLYLCLAILLIDVKAIAQTSCIKGQVRDYKNQALMGINVFFKNQVASVVQTNSKGKFVLCYVEKMQADSVLIFSSNFNDFETKQINTKLLTDTTAVIYLSMSKILNLNEVIIKSTGPISEQFTTIQLEAMDVYLNPLAQADPLKAITSLPYSTNTDESANPSLRGSSADRSRVIYNGVPIYSPVRNTVINGTGNFSLFNTELLQKELVYPSNPPLTYGNASAGMVDITTKSKAPNNQTQLSLALASIGVYKSMKINPKSFIQVYGNHQFLPLFKNVNASSLSFLNDFKTNDLGINWRYQINERSFVNVFNYVIDEKFDANSKSFNYSGDNIAKKTRNFSIINFQFPGLNSLIFVNAKSDFSRQSYEYGAIHSLNVNQEYFGSVNLKKDFYKHFIQVGISHENLNYEYTDSIPNFPFGLKPNDSKYFENKKISNKINEYYLFYKYDIIPQTLLFSLGFRNNIPQSDIKTYYNAQNIIKYNFLKYHGVNLGYGMYKNFSNPNVISKRFNLQTSKQISLDYEFKHKEKLLNIGLFYKKEQEEFKNTEPIESTSILNNKIWGIEAYVEYELLPSLKISCANTYLNSKIINEENSDKAENNLKYFIKANVQLSSKWGNFALSYITRPGMNYTPIIDSKYLDDFKIYAPIYELTANNGQYPDYKSVSFNYNKMMLLNNKKSLLVFFNFNNLLDIKNVRNYFYSEDYKTILASNYMERSMIYFGMILSLIPKKD
ncbi:MAG: TonB-dependent receptor [Sphingobacteriaceae bacterium]|nr:TonB-dependent receptor [Sphingobacteriaceae bacterium]